MAVKSVAKSGYRMAVKGDRGEIYLYGTIGDDWMSEGVSATQFTNDLKALKGAKTIDLRINSEGGSVFDATTMYSLLRAHGAKIIVHIDGLAASAASYIAMAGDEIRIAESAFIMIHNASGGVLGTADEQRKLADLLDSVSTAIRDVYAARTGNTVDQIKTWMDEETWFSGKEAMGAKFADTMVANLKVAASVRDPSKFKHLPASLYPKRAAALVKIESMKAARG